MRYSCLLLSCLVAFGLAGCSDENPASFSREGEEMTATKLTVSMYPAGSARLKVMTRNLYLGTSIGPILSAAPEEIPLAMAQGWAEVLAVDFAERAQALAEEIAWVEPHLIGLQEVALYRMQSPGDFLQGNPEPATQVVIDYLEILQAALSERGLDYRVVSATTGMDIEMPVATNMPLDDLRFTDREVILARADVRVENPQGGHFAATVPVPVAGIQVNIVRGWAAVDVRVAGQSLRFISTHLETAGFAPIQVMQGTELIEMTDATDVPVVLVGDFNSAADGSRTPTYGNLVDGGFVDVWDQANPGDLGYTCCHADDLRNAEVDFNRRIDLIFVRPVSDRAAIRRVVAEVVGDEPENLTASGMWPSDHAGAWAAFRLHPVPQGR